MATEDLLVHNGGDGETVETVGECFPQFDVVASLACQRRKCKETDWRDTDYGLTFIIKTVNPVDGSTLVVAS